MMIIHNQLEQMVRMVSKQTGQLPCDIRLELMRQNNMTPEQYVSMNPIEIRGTLGKGFMGQPG